MQTNLAIFSVPGGVLNEPPIELNITAIVEKEQRLDDVARVNTQTAPELLTVFNRCWLDLDRVCVALTDAKNKAKQAIETIECQLTLECTNEVLEAKGHFKASADLRKAWIGCNYNLVKSKERLIEISTVLNYMLGKQQAFKNGYDSVKKLINPQLPIDSNPGKMPEPFVNRGTGNVNPKPSIVNAEGVPEDEWLPPGFGKLKL
jgi:hypothetical protein